MQRAEADFPKGTRLYIYKNASQFIFSTEMPQGFKFLTIAMTAMSVGFLAYRIFWLR